MSRGRRSAVAVAAAKAPATSIASNANDEASSAQEGGYFGSGFDAPNEYGYFESAITVAEQKRNSGGTERARLVPFYERLGGTLRADSACAGSGATVFTLRLEAPSGPVTSLGAASPRWFSTDGNLEGAARAKGEDGPQPRELDTTVSAFYHY